MEEQQEFTVHDRRRTETGPAEKPEARKPAAEKGTPLSPGQKGGPGGEPAEEVDFATFILSLAASAQIGLGAIPHPSSNKPERDLPTAKQMIDVIAMLQEKTKGNLSAEEGTLLEQVLFNLRMHYVRVSEEEKKSGES
jgi:hypothetical protein